MTITKDDDKATPTEQGISLLECVTAFSGSLILVCCGTLTGWNSPSLPKLMAEGSHIPLTEEQVSWLASTPAFGGTVGPLLAMNFMNRIGRKKALLISIVPCIISWILIIIATNVPTLFVARFFGGLTIGLSLFICPMYLGEIASVRTRGILSALCILAFYCGCLFSFAVGPYISISTMGILCLIIAILFLISFWTMPESPYYLAMSGNFIEAESALVRLRGTSSNVSAEFETIVKFVGSNCNKQKSSTGTWCEESIIVHIFRNRASRKAFYITLLLRISQMAGGIFYVQAYEQMIFTRIGSTSIEPQIAPLIMTSMQIVTSIIAFAVINYFNRRTILVFSGISCIFCAFMTTCYFSAQDVFDVNVIEYANFAVASILLYDVTLACGVTSIHGALMTELFTTEVKAKASCLVAVFTSISCGVSIKVYMVMATQWGYFAPFGTITFFLILIIPTILYLLPETKGKSLAEIQHLLGNTNDKHQGSDVSPVTP